MYRQQNNLHTEPELLLCKSIDWEAENTAKKGEQVERPH